MRLVREAIALACRDETSGGWQRTVEDAYAAAEAELAKPTYEALWEDTAGCTGIHGLSLNPRHVPSRPSFIRASSPQLSTSAVALLPSEPTAPTLGLLLIRGPSPRV